MRYRFRSAFTVSATVCLAAFLLAAADGGPLNSVDESDADEDVLAGHSYHGEFLNEGPRQAAYLMPGTGAVEFPVTTENPRVQAFIEQGVGQLHGFWYLEAERSFRQAAALDRDCAMAYWGAALATKKVSSRARGFIAEAVERKEKVSKRERMYIEALDGYLNFGVKKKDDAKDKDQAASADDKETPLDKDQKKKRAEDYTKALESIALEFPEDIEAKAFLALQLYENQGELPNPSYLAVDGLLDKVFAAQPMHPAHHFRIHLWDYKKPEMALESAARCGPSAAGIAHMWHMPGHIYSRLKRYEDAAWQQEASARVDHAHMMRDRLMPDQIHNFAHNNEWLIRNLQHIGRVRDAVDLAKNMTELPRHPKYNTLDKRGSAYYGRMRLIETLHDFELWEEAYSLCQQTYLESTGKEKDQIARLRLLGSACFMSDRVQAGESVIADLEERLESQRRKQKEAGERAGEREADKRIDAKLVRDAGSAAVNEAFVRAMLSSDPNVVWGLEPDSDSNALSELQDCKAGAEVAVRLEQLKEHSKEIEKAKTDARKPFETPINDLVKAVAQVKVYRAIAKQDFDAALPLLKQASRNVSPLVAVRVELRCGNVKKALELATKEVERNKGEVLPLACLVDLHFAAGDWDAAKQQLETLRDYSSSIDNASPVFQRINVVAKQLGIEGDWRRSSEPRDDLGQRPPLDELGPFRWSPSPAPGWKLVDAKGEVRTLADYEGKPVVLIFYLGAGCLHCAQQLQAFAPLEARFAEQGLQIVAISTEKQADLKKSVDLYDGQPLPFPLLANAKQDVFKEYRVYDDFENQPLHGTFIIDRDGMVRWQDIGYEPFMDPEFVLGEAQRLLGQSAKQ